MCVIVLIVNAVRYRCTVTNYTCGSGSRAAHCLHAWAVPLRDGHKWVMHTKPQAIRGVDLAQLPLGSHGIYIWETIRSLNSSVYAFASLAPPH